MHAKIALFAFAALPLAGATVLGGRTMVLHEKRDGVPSGFVKIGPAPAQKTLTLRLGLAQSDAAGLEGRLMAVSTPSSPDYGNFLTKDEVRCRSSTQCQQLSECRRSTSTLRRRRRRSRR